MIKQAAIELSELCQAIGQHVDYAQGGGGNISVKANDDTMLVKASGVALQAVDQHHGFVSLHYQPIRDYLTHTDQGDAHAFLHYVYDQMLPEHVKHLRPSLEVGFHTLLGKYVIHCHSVYANILNCATEGEGLVKQLFPEAIWIPYCTPGHPLTRAIFSVMCQSPTTLFLQNHGLIISGSSKEEALRLHSAVNDQIRTYFSIEKMSKSTFNGSIPDKQHILFPDQVVYTATPELAKTQAGQETLAAYSFVLQSIERLGLTTHVLSGQDIADIQSMESEHYRQRMVR